MEIKEKEVKMFDVVLSNYEVGCIKCALKCYSKRMIKGYTKLYKETENKKNYHELRCIENDCKERCGTIDKILETLNKVNLK